MSQPAQLVEWLAQVANGDNASLRALYDATSAKLFGVCLRVCQDRPGAEEALQEAYLRVWRSASCFDVGKGSAIAWLCMIARNCAIDWRRANPVPLRDDSADEIADEPFADFSSDSDRNQDLMRCMETLADNQALAVRAAFYGGLSYSEVSQQLGVPLGTLKSWIRRAMLSLRECIDHD